MHTIRERKKHIKKTHIKNCRGSQGGGPGRGVSGSEFFMLVSFFPERISEGGGGSRGLGRGGANLPHCTYFTHTRGGGSKVQFWGSFLYV